MRPTFLRWCVRLGVVAVFTAASVVGVEKLMPQASYLPKGNKNLIFGIMLTPPAYNLDQNQFIGERIERGIRPYWEAASTQEATRIGPVINFFTHQPYPAVPAIDNYFFVSFRSTIFMGCSSRDRQLVAPLGAVLSGAMSSIPGSFGFAQQASIFGRGLGGGNSIDLEISSPDMAKLRQSAETIYRQLTGTFGFGAVRPTPLNFNLTGPEIQIRPDYVRASELGLNLTNLGLSVQALVDGALAGDYRLEGDSIDLRIVRDPAYRLTADMLANVPIAYRDRQGRVGAVPLNAVTKVVSGDAPQQILRIEEQRSVRFLVTPPPRMPLEQASDQIGRMVGTLKKQGQLAPDLEVRLAGTADKLVQVHRTLLGRWTGWNRSSLFSVGTSRMVMALLVTYLLMAALFESFMYPFVIMFSVPLAAVGGFGGLALVRLFWPAQQLDMLTMLGFVILIGVVVNNAILIVHQAINFMQGRADDIQGSHDLGAGVASGVASGGQVRGMSGGRAIAQSIRTRVRPIFMTTLTSVFGMLPLVLMPGSGSELYRGLGSVVIGGLVVSTVFTLVVVPMVFSVVLDVRSRFNRRATPC